MQAALDTGATTPLDRPHLEGELGAQGWAVLPQLLTPDQCQATAIRHMLGAFRQAVRLLRIHVLKLDDEQHWQLPSLA